MNTRTDSVADVALTSPATESGERSTRVSHIPRPLLPALTGIAALGAVTMVALVDPNHPGHYPLCPSLQLFGVYCPGCGSMRAVHDLAHLDFAGAWGMNPLVFFAIPYLVWQWVRWVFSSVGRPLHRTLAPAWVLWLLFAGLIAFGVLRNVPALEPFLAP